MLIKVGSFALETSRGILAAFFFSLFLLMAGGAALGWLWHQTSLAKEEVERKEQELSSLKSDLATTEEKLERAKRTVSTLQKLLKGKNLFQKESEVYNYLLELAKQSGVEPLLIQKEEPSSKKKKKKKNSGDLNVKVVLKSPNKERLYLFLIKMKRTTVFSIAAPEEMVLHDTLLKATFTFPMIKSNELEKLKRLKVL
ncbi:MAG: hypothetical protein GXO16_07565 [Epsilonproteobacteria bacterium]|nr:hypothetical protein [Campylobacterota bacterium]